MKISREEKVQTLKILIREYQARVEHRPETRGRIEVLEAILVDYIGERRAGR